MEKEIAEILLFRIGVSTGYLSGKVVSLFSLGDATTDRLIDCLLSVDVLNVGFDDQTSVDEFVRRCSGLVRIKTEGSASKQTPTKHLFGLWRKVKVTCRSPEGGFIIRHVSTDPSITCHGQRGLKSTDEYRKENRRQIIDKITSVSKSVDAKIVGDPTSEYVAAVHHNPNTITSYLKSDNITVCPHTHGVIVGQSTTNIYFKLSTSDDNGVIVKTDEKKYVVSERGHNTKMVEYLTTSGYTELK
jgi:hypothetical protein